MSIFYDVDAFMKAAGHGPDPKKVSLYLDLVREEIAELEQAMSDYHAAENLQDEQLAKADALDAICDSIWVLIGLARVMDLPVDQGCDAVTITNFRKVDLSIRRPLLTNCGSFTRRAHHLRHQSNTPLRIQAVEMQLDLGTL